MAPPLNTLLHVLDFALVLCRGVGGTVVSTRAFHVTQVRFLLSAVIRLKFHLGRT